MRDKVIAITGATGFVGSYLTRYFAEKNYKIYAFGRRDKFDLVNIVEKYISWDISKSVLNQKIDVDFVIHCAGSVTYWGDYAEMRKINETGTKNVINSFVNAKIIHISTASVYNSFQSKFKLSENQTDPEKFINSYQRTKLQAEKIVKKLSRNYIIFRPHIIYGKGDTTIFPRLLKARKPNIKRFLMLGDGSNIISLTYIGNLAKAIELGIQSKIKNEIFNVSDELTDTTERVLSKLKDIVGFKEKFLFIPKKLAWSVGRFLEIIYYVMKIQKEPVLTRYVVMQMASDYTLDLSKIKKELGYSSNDNYLNKFSTCYGN